MAVWWNALQDFGVLPYRYRLRGRTSLCFFSQSVILVHASKRWLNELARLL